MTEKEACAHAQELWGKTGKAELLSIYPPPSYLNHPFYKVGKTALDAKLGGNIREVMGSSWVSFEAAFENVAEREPLIIE